MVDISHIVDVVISKETQSISQMGFGTPLILGFNGPGADYEVRKYSSIDEVADDYDAADVEYQMANAVFAQSPRVRTVKIATLKDGESYVENLTEIVKRDNDWYGLLADTVDKAIVEDIAEWVEAHYKIYFTRSNDENIYNSESEDDIAAILQAAERERTAVIFNETNDDFIDACLMGKGLAYMPGSITYKFKTLSGPKASTALTATQRAAILGKNCNLYSRIAGVSMIEEGTMASGEFIDIIIGVDFLRARMAENIFSKLINAKKIPYTDAGIAIIEAEIRAILENAIKIGIIARAPEMFDGRDYDVYTPKVAEISDNDRANRLLPDVTWQARLAGAIHKVLIRGYVRV